MSELQNDSVESESNITFQEDTAEVENHDLDNGAELATASEAEHEEKPQADVNQEAIQKVINKKHFEAKEAERKAQELQKKIEEYEAKERDQLAQSHQNLPPEPDPFSENYEQELADYRQAITNKAKWDAAQEVQAQQLQYQQQQEQARQQQEINDRLNSYTNKARELNISTEELQSAANTIGAYEPPMELQMAILADESGPLITKHLANNPVEMQQLIDAVKFNPILAGQKFSEIKAAASALKPKTSNAPSPTTRVDGGQVDLENARYPHTKGAKFE